MGISLGRTLAAAMVFAVALGFGGPSSNGPGIGSAYAQQATEATQDVDRSRTGGAQTLEEILRRQRGEPVPLDAGTGPGNSAAPSEQLGTLGGASDSELWRRARQGDSFSVSIPDKKSAILVQDEGEEWLATRRDVLPMYTKYALGGIIVLLAIFMLLRGRVKIQAGWSSIKIERFTFIERFGHWLLATSFIILAITGLGLLFGREYIVPGLDWMHAKTSSGTLDPDYGKKAFASFALAGKWMHNNIAWAFIVSLFLIFVMWFFRNIPTWTDVKWLLQGGGLLSKNSHPHARKFNGGQKIIFWSVILLGGSISASGISLLQPYEYGMFAATFDKMNIAGEAIGYPLGLETAITPFQEMQYAQLWHTIVSIVLIVIIIAHIYIGSVGMQGAFSAMGSGKVDLNWAREHHDLWVAKLEKQGKIPKATGSFQKSRPMPMRAPKKPTPAE